MARTTIHTLGYEGANIDGFIKELRANDIACLIDVRAAPYSRKPDFTKPALRTRLESAEIDYQHLAALGNPKAGRDAAISGEVETYIKIFRNHLNGDAAQTALAAVVRLTRERRACLMCLEANPEHCHRSLIADRLAQDYGLAVRHLQIGGQRQFDF